MLVALFIQIFLAVSKNKSKSIFKYRKFWSLPLLSKIPIGNMAWAHHTETSDLYQGFFRCEVHKDKGTSKARNKTELISTQARQISWLIPMAVKDRWNALKFILKGYKIQTCFNDWRSKSVLSCPFFSPVIQPSNTSSPCRYGVYAWPWAVV